MQHFRNILLVSHAEKKESQAVRQALELAVRNQAALTILVLYPKLPDSLIPYRDKLEQGLLAALLRQVEESGPAAAAPPPVMVFADSSVPSVDVVRRVLLNRHDLVIKEADTGDTPETGFHAFDMDLLRKCPCPVWLCRPFRHEAPRLKIATAVDPDNEGPASRALSLRLLQLGASLATLYDVPLHVVSCWDFPMENYLRHSTWVTLPDHELTDMIVQTRTRHDRAMQSLIREAGIEPVGLEAHHIRGPAAQAIPRLVAEGHVDILIMGTVARTGIPGFIIGNTAEDILRKVDCTLVALKPDGFVTPVSP